MAYLCIITIKSGSQRPSFATIVREGLEPQDMVPDMTYAVPEGWSVSYEDTENRARIMAWQIGSARAIILELEPGREPRHFALWREIMTDGSILRVSLNEIEAADLPG
jgi:hypothetical protein